MKSDLKELKKVLAYDKNSGIFSWRVDRFKMKAGDRAGTIRYCANKPYAVICYMYHFYYAHRLAWEFMNGEIKADYFIDHINGNGLDNRIVNLRLVTKQQNTLNKINNNPYKGTTPYKGKYQAQIKVDGNNVYLGLFDDRDTAREIFRKAESLRNKERGM